MGRRGASRRGRPRITRRQMLDSRPVRNQALSYQNLENGEVAIRVPRRQDVWGKLLGWVLVVPRERQLVLDQVGALVWELCDGEHTVGEMIQALRRAQKLNAKEAEVALTDYLRQLGKRRLVGFAVPRGEEIPGKEARAGYGQGSG